MYVLDLTGTHHTVEGFNSVIFTWYVYNQLLLLIYVVYTIPYTYSYSVIRNN